MPTLALKKFSEIKHLLPSDSWAANRNHLHGGEFESEWVLFHEGDLTLDSLNLDSIEILAPALPNNEIIFLLLVVGNLTVKHYIYNENTDGATGLIILGNLQTQNALVGGQEIFVTGNSIFSEVFWGDYNHGDLTVKGDVSALVFMETEQYHVNIEGKQAFTYHLSNYDEVGDWQSINSASIAGIFDEILYFEDVSDDEDSQEDLINVLNRGSEVLSHLQAGKSLLCADFIAKGYQPAKQNEISYEDLLQLATKQSIRDILGLSYVKDKYPDYYDPDKNGYWYNNLHFSFRQKSADKSERIHVSKEIKSDTEEFDCNMIHYDIETNPAGMECVAIKFQAHNGWEQEPVPILPNDTAMVQQAYQRFKAMHLAVTRASTEEIEYAAKLARKTEKAWAKQTPYEATHVECSGVTFKVLMLREANAYLGNLTWGIANQEYPVQAFPAPATEGYYLVAEEDVVCDKFDMDWENQPENIIVAGFIFLKNLTIDTCLLANEIDISPFFVVLGDLKAANIGLWGNTHFVGGKLNTQLLYGKYNHGSLFVGGHATCLCVVSDDFEMSFGNLNTYAIVDDIGRIKKTIQYTDENSEVLSAIIAYPATHDLNEVFIDAIYQAEDDGYGGHYLAVSKKMLANMNCLDMKKIQAPIAHFKANVAKDFEHLFKRPHFKSEDFWMVYPNEEDTKQYYFAYKSESGKFTLSFYNNDYTYKHMVMFSPKKGLKNLLSKGAEIDIYVTYYEQDNDTEKLEFTLTPNEECLEAYQAMHSFSQAIQQFKSN
ncbi:MAG: hypothetical protein WBP13_07885 [Methylophilaceae bacterium]